MYVGKDFDPADPSESEVYSFDFVRDLTEGESIASATWTIAVAADSAAADPAAATRLSGGPSNAGTITSQRVVGLLDGVKYVLSATVTSNLGNKATLFSHVTSRSPS